MCTFEKSSASCMNIRHAALRTMITASKKGHCGSYTSVRGISQETSVRFSSLAEAGRVPFPKSSVKHQRQRESNKEQSDTRDDQSCVVFRVETLKSGIGKQEAVVAAQYC